MYRQRCIVSTYSDRRTYCKTLWIKASAKFPKWKWKYPIGVSYYLLSPMCKRGNQGMNLHHHVSSSQHMNPSSGGKHSISSSLVTECAFSLWDKALSPLACGRLLCVSVSTHGWACWWQLHSRPRVSIFLETNLAVILASGASLQS